jgi:hypothetical protein
MDIYRLSFSNRYLVLRDQLKIVTWLLPLVPCISQFTFRIIHQLISSQHLVTDLARTLAHPARYSKGPEPV